LGNIGLLQDKLKRLNVAPEPLDYALMVFAGDNGVSRENLSYYEPMSSCSIVVGHLTGRSPTARLMQRLNREEWIVDVGLARDIPIASERLITGFKAVQGTGNILEGPALSREQVVKSLQAGEATVEMLVERGKSALGLGEIGVGNTLSAYALTVELLGLPPSRVVGWGSDNRGDLYEHRLRLVTSIARRQKDSSRHVLSALEEVGSSEIIAMAGAVLGACRLNVPVMLDGFVSAVAALAAYHLDEGSARVLIAPTLTRERAHPGVLNELGLTPLLNLNMGYGEGLAAGLGLFLLEMANDFRTKQDLCSCKEN